MSEQEPKTTTSEADADFAEYAAAKRQEETRAFQDVIFGDSVNGRSEEDVTRVEEGLAYYRHLEELSKRGDNHSQELYDKSLAEREYIENAYTEALEDDRVRDIKLQIASDIRFKRLMLLAEQTSETRGRINSGDSSAGPVGQLKDRELKFEELRNWYANVDHMNADVLQYISELAMSTPSLETSATSPVDPLEGLKVSPLTGEQGPKVVAPLEDIKLSPLPPTSERPTKVNNLGDAAMEERINGEEKGNVKLALLLNLANEIASRRNHENIVGENVKELAAELAAKELKFVKLFDIWKDAGMDIKALEYTREKAFGPSSRETILPVEKQLREQIAADKAELDSDWKAIESAKVAKDHRPFRTKLGEMVNPSADIKIAAHDKRLQMLKRELGKKPGESDESYEKAMNRWANSALLTRFVLSRIVIGKGKADDKLNA